MGAQIHAKTSAVLDTVINKARYPNDRSRGSRVLVEGIVLISTVGVAIVQEGTASTHADGIDVRVLAIYRRLDLSTSVYSMFFKWYNFRRTKSLYFLKFNLTWLLDPLSRGSLASQSHGCWCLHLVWELELSLPALLVSTCATTCIASFKSDSSIFLALGVEWTSPPPDTPPLSNYWNALLWGTCGRPTCSGVSSRLRPPPPPL